MKTSELIGCQLDWAVIYAQCIAVYNCRVILARDLANKALRNGMEHPSTDWSQGGQIIEREGILLRPIKKDGHQLDGQWLAMYDGANTGTMVQWVKRTTFPRHYLSGPTPLIAAMRCYVASKLGDDVEIPEELQ